MNPHMVPYHFLLMLFPPTARILLRFNSQRSAGMLLRIFGIFPHYGYCCQSATPTGPVDGVGIVTALYSETNVITFLDLRGVAAITLPELARSKPQSVVFVCHSEQQRSGEG